MHPTRERVIAVLRQLEVSYDLLEIDANFSDTAAFCERYGIPPGQSANTILIETKKDPIKTCACVVLATTKLDVNGKCRELLGGKCSFARPERMTALTGMEFGAVTLFGLPDAIPVYVDSRVFEVPWVIVGAGERSAKLKVDPTLFLKLPSVKCVEGLAKPTTF